MGAVVIFPDVSELVQLQSQVLHTEKMASLGRLAAGVAHEINNPMGFVHANLAQMGEYLSDVARLLDAARSSPERFASLSRELDAETLLADFGQAIRESQEGSERIRHIVQDLRAFAYRDDGEWVAADLNRCLDSTAHIVWTMMKHSVVLQKEYAALPPVRCHPKQLEQVFMNLLVNAYQAIEARLTRDGGGNGEIVLRTACTDEGVLIAVSDDGAGIAPEHADRIFEPFFTTKEVGEGTGLGLSTSFEIVRRHGGTIRALPREGGGTTFEVLAPTAGSRRPGTAIVSNDTPTLLVVDDEARILSALRRSLRREGWRVLTASTPDEALRLLEEEPIDAVLSDHKMPRMSGLELLEVAARCRPNAARILISGWPDEIPAERLARARRSRTRPQAVGRRRTQTHPARGARRAPAELTRGGGGSGTRDRSSGSSWRRRRATGSGAGVRPCSRCGPCRRSPARRS